jgi:fatty-acyl-CoA synthase
MPSRTMTKPPDVAARQRDLWRRFPSWEARTLDQMLDAAAAEFADRPCIITDQQTWSYRDVQRWSERIAAGLVAAGVRPGHHVALLMANYPEFIAVKFAIARAGAVAVPINFLNRRDELGYVLRQSDAVLLITMDRFRGMDYLQSLDELAPGWERHGGGADFPNLRNVVVFPTGDLPPRAGASTLESFSAHIGPWRPIDHPGAATNSDIIYTSGTTGPPKGVMLTHDMMLRTAFGSTYGRAFEDGRRILFSLPMYHVYGYVEGLLAALFVGGAVIPQLRFDPAETLRAIAAHGASDILLIPTMTLALLAELKKPDARYDLSTLHAVISSGGRAPAYIWQEIFDHLRPDELTTGYGMTEVTASSTVTRPGDPIERLLGSNGRLRDVGPAGDTANGGLLVAYRVVDPDTGAVLGPGQVGELQARGFGVTSGYYNKPEATAAAFTADGWLHTGDLGSVDSDGYLWLAGRLKESYRCGGEQVMPTEAEDLLVTHPAVLQAHVVPVPDLRMGEVGVAFVVLREGSAVQPDELIAFCTGRLARFKVPRHVLPIRAQDIPSTPSGRARKFLLVKLATETLGLA